MTRACLGNHQVCRALERFKPGAASVLNLHLESTRISYSADGRRRKYEYTRILDLREPLANRTCDRRSAQSLVLHPFLKRRERQKHSNRIVSISSVEAGEPSKLNTVDNPWNLARSL